MSLIDTMSWYCVQFLGDLAIFLMFEPVFLFVVLAILLAVCVNVGRLMVR